MATSKKIRTATIKRDTTETQIALKLNIDGTGVYKVSTGIRFFDHMLELFTRHGGFDLTLMCKGDLDVDQHHTVEDVGIALGEAFNKALGDKKGILRAGYFVMAMDETLAVAAVDLSGRVAYVVDDKVKVRLVGDFQSRAAGGLLRRIRAWSEGECPCEDDVRALATTTRSRRSSRHLHGRCVGPARAMSGWRRCCRAQRDCCDRSHRLQSGQSHQRAQGAELSRRGDTRYAVA